MKNDITKTAKPTVEDFAKATFAFHEDGGIAQRAVGTYADVAYPWNVHERDFGFYVNSDEEMVQYGWGIVPFDPKAI